MIFNRECYDNDFEVLAARASILQDYWGDIKEDWRSGGRKFPGEVQRWSLGRESGERSPPVGYRDGALVGGRGDKVP